ALICTTGSVLGGILGYIFGKFGGRPLFNHFFGKNADKLNAVEKLYEQYGSFAVFFSAFSPIPYNIFTIASGILNMNIFKFIAVSALGRGGRFFLECTVLMLFGEAIKQYMNYVIVAVTVLFIIFFAVLYKKRHSIVKSDISEMPTVENMSVKNINNKESEKELCL
ncbi:DedA family protein, partial [bacterium]|nr:DedA family protein [bacterium]